jgi:hypothetical protein
LLLLPQLHGAILEPLFPNPHDTLTGSDNVHIAQKHTSMRSESDEACICAELTEELISIKVEDVSHLFGAAITSVRVERCCRV